jgi:hypothetical protein
MNANTGGPAFPCDEVIEYGNGPRQITNSGMTLRDYFAAKAMQAWLSRQPDPLPAPQWFGRGHEDIDARSCYRIADAMLAARGQ